MSSAMTAGNENADPAEASAAAELKAPVPSRDRRLVLSAIDGQVNAAKASWREKHGATAGAGKEAFILGCIDQAGASMKRQVAAATIPADGAEGALDAFETELLAVRPLASPRTDAESDDDESLSSVDDEGDLSFDDAEVLDREAYDRARELRARAREVAARVIAVAELLEVHGYSEDGEEGRDDGGPAEGAAAEEGTGASAAMQQALQALASSVQGVDAGLADKLESLKETIGTIDSSVEKYQRAARGDQSALSQTEKALLASETPRESALASLAEEDEDTTDPNKKLARLLAGVL